MGVERLEEKVMSNGSADDPSRVDLNDLMKKVREEEKKSKRAQEPPPITHEQGHNDCPLHHFPPTRYFVHQHCAQDQHIILKSQKWHLWQQIRRRLYLILTDYRQTYYKAVT